MFIGFYVQLPLIVSNFSKKTIPLQALRGPEGSRRLRLPDFKTRIFSTYFRKILKYPI
jgi:hypothetical protein